MSKREWLDQHPTIATVAFIVLVMVVGIGVSQALSGPDTSSDAYRAGKACAARVNPGQPEYMPGQTEDDVMDFCMGRYEYGGVVLVEGSGDRSDYQAGVRDGYDGGGG
jgi:hypothetical protein